MKSETENCVLYDTIHMKMSEKAKPWVRSVVVWGQRWEPRLAINRYKRTVVSVGLFLVIVALQLNKFTKRV